MQYMSSRLVEDLANNLAKDKFTFLFEESAVNQLIRTCQIKMNLSK